MRRAAVEQPGEQAAEVAVDRLERGAQPFAALAIEAADRAAQAVDRLGQFGLLGGAGAVTRLGLGQFVGGDQIDRADPLAVGGEAVHRGAFFPGQRDLGGGEGEALGQQRRRALEALARDAAHFGAALFLAGGARGGSGAALPRAGERFGGFGEGGFGQPRSFRGVGDRAFGSGHLLRQPLAHSLTVLDLAQQRGGLGGDDRALPGDLLEPAAGFGKAARGVAGPGLPAANVAALGGGPLAGDRQRLIVRGERGGGALQSGAGGIVPGLRGGKLRASTGRIGQGVAPCLRCLALGLACAELFGDVFGCGSQFGLSLLVPGPRRLGPVDLAQCGAFGLGGGCQRAVGSDQCRLNFCQLGLDYRAGVLRLGQRLPERGQFRFECGEAVGRFEPRRFRRAFAARDEPVPAAQAPGAGDQPFAGGERAAVVGLGDMDQREPRGEFGRAAGDMGGEAVGHRRGCRRPGPEPSVAIVGRGTERAAGIAPEHRGERAFIARRGAHLVERGRQAVAALGLLRARLGIADQRLMLALDSGEFGACGGERAGGSVARALQFGLARLVAFDCARARCETGRGLVARGLNAMASAAAGSPARSSSRARCRMATPAPLPTVARRCPAAATSASATRHSASTPACAAVAWASASSAARSDGRLRRALPPARGGALRPRPACSRPRSPRLQAARVLRRRRGSGGRRRRGRPQAAPAGDRDRRCGFRRLPAGCPASPCGGRVRWRRRGGRLVRHARVASAAAAACWAAWAWAASPCAAAT